MNRPKEKPRPGPVHMGELGRRSGASKRKKKIERLAKQVEGLFDEPPSGPVKVGAREFDRTLPISPAVKKKP